MKATQMPQLGRADCNEGGISNSEEFQISELNLISNYNIISLLTSASVKYCTFPPFFFNFKIYLRDCSFQLGKSFERDSLVLLKHSRGGTQQVLVLAVSTPYIGVLRM